MVATQGNDAPLYVTVKMWVAHFKATIPDLHSKIQNKIKSSISQVFLSIEYYFEFHLNYSVS